MDRKPTKLLLFEDNPGDARLVQLMLAETSEISPPPPLFELVHVTQLAAGLARLKEERFDVILLDLSLLDSHGMQTLTQVQIQASEVPIIVLSGLNDENLAIEAVQAGAQDYLVKGQFGSHLLTRSIRYAIERHRMRLELEAYTRKLEDSETRFRRLIEKNADGVLIVDEAGIIRFVNPAAEVILDQPAEALLGQLFGRPLVIGKKTELEIARDGGRLPSVVELRVVEIVWHDEPGYLTSMRDITERKWAERALQEAKHELEATVEVRTRDLRDANDDLVAQIMERRAAEQALSQALTEAEQTRDNVSAILSSVADGLIVTDGANRIVMMNQVAGHILGVEVDKIIDQPIDLAIENEQLRDQLKAAWAKDGLGPSQSGSYQFNFEVLPGDREFNGKPEQPQVIQARIAVIKGKVDRPRGLITMIYDITREREVERLKSEFIATAAHELRTPLTSIRGFSEILLLRDDFDRDTQRRYLSHINDQAVSLSKTVNDLLHISQMESGQHLLLRKAPCSPDKLIERVIHRFEAEAGQHQFDLVLNDLAADGEWVVDEQKIEQVLEKLLNNAIKYAPHGGLIQVTAQPCQQSSSSTDHYRISIKDQGIGMTKEQTERIFDKFYRADASHTALGGVGIGMSIVKQIVEAHDGKIWVKSEPGKGTEISFVI